MDNTKFDSLTADLAKNPSRRRFLCRLAAAGLGAAATVAVGRTQPAAAAGSCAYGPATCRRGYVWREAYFGDRVCVTPDQRDQAANDNTQAPYRVDPYGAYGPNSCVSGYVWREANPSDFVCVEPWVRDQVRYDNSQAPYRVKPGCA